MADVASLIGRLERLLDRLMDGGVVPFIGAGVSYGAESSQDPRFRSAPEVMRDALKERFKQENNKQKIDKHIHPIIFEKNPDSVCKNLNLDRLAEVGTWAWGSGKVCEILLIAYSAQTDQSFRRKVTTRSASL